jgi:hypothetical protein
MLFIIIAEAVEQIWDYGIEVYKCVMLLRLWLLLLWCLFVFLGYVFLGQMGMK